MTATASTQTPAPPRGLLAHHLRQLKLPTVLREYEKVAAEAARDGHDHIRYLLRLVELELIDRELYRAPIQSPSPLPKPATSSGGTPNP